MLVERIKHENRALSQADTLSISSHKPGSQRGQVRRFTLNSPARLHTNFQNIEDSIADEVAEKVLNVLNRFINNILVFYITLNS
ncbi:hypothetical protein DPMN_110920 [Dreissena polymorpha]|uniref:Uncharacterized protein n=1 Tax=Dreissena polymorpha TaxID=45954 RepID=A0A9D4QPD7_DREPO|nr:hypothetical protein DPMN_110917 [Dreissena polymorpha]KAH3837528.1 hypothetical protein DPMN_110920 [Dreissena polymorpha]